MWGLDVCLGGLHFMVLMPPSQRNLQEDHASAGLIGAALSGVLLQERKKSLNLRVLRSKLIFQAKTMLEHLHAI